MNYEQRIENLNRHIEGGTLVRNSWGDGRDRACLLAAMSPECAESESAMDCPASVMPKWLAELTPWMDDDGSEEAWPHMVRRYAALAARWHVLSDGQWSRLEFVAKKIAVESCREHNEGACAPVIALLDRAIAGDIPRDEEWSAARSAAWSAADPAARSAAWSAVSDAAADAASAAADAAASDAAWAAAWSAARDAAAELAARDDADAADAADAAPDRITTSILDAIEFEIEKQEPGAQ